MKNILQTWDGERLFVLTDLITIKVSAKDTANHYSVIEEILPVRRRTTSSPACQSRNFLCARRNI
jgi:hypothetical protein